MGLYFSLLAYYSLNRDYLGLQILGFTTFMIIIVFILILYNLRERIYIKKNGNIYFWWKKLKNIDYFSFKPLKFGYVKDKYNVFFEWKRLPNIDVNTFEILKFWYAKDKNNVYYNWEKMNNVDVNSFEVLKFWYAKDKNNVYVGKDTWNDLFWINIDVETFEPLSWSYVKDKNGVYYDFDKIEWADPGTFRIIKSSYDYDAKDKNYYYFEGKKKK